jgi:hypothetical protein
LRSDLTTLAFDYTPQSEIELIKRWSALGEINPKDKEGHDLDFEQTVSALQVTSNYRPHAY